MVRAHDEHFPPEEVLYRRLGPDELNGPYPVLAAMSLSGGCSTARSRHCKNAPLDALLGQQDPPTDCAVVGARVRDIGFGRHKDGKDKEWDLIPKDDPRDKTEKFPELPAHAEIRLVRPGESEQPKKIPDSLRKNIAMALCKVFKLCYRLPLDAQRTCPQAGHQAWGQYDTNHVQDASLVVRGGALS
jgi:hypothetical protein